MCKIVWTLKPQDQEGRVSPRIKEEHNSIVLMDAYSHALELTIHYPQPAVTPFKEQQPITAFAAPNTQMIAEWLFANEWGANSET